ncbi:cytochrome P450 [Aspergillus stella-maris]|uniref:cytochrome P450 n=1 Tax=Aspergillus stella-maris TaxID=1810926 RepID=UPI003CCE0CE1
MSSPLQLLELRGSIVVAGLVLIFVTAFTFRTILLDKRCSLDAPRWGDHLGSKARQRTLLTSSKSIYLDNYHKFKDALGFRIQSDGEEKLVISPRYLDELRRLPHSVLSFEDAHSESPVTKYTDTPPPKFFHIVPHVTKARLTPALTRVMPILSAEANRVIPLEMGRCREWTAMNIHQRVMRIIAVLAGRVFIGPELCHDERYIDAAVNYTIEFGKASQDIEGLTPWMRPFYAKRLKSVMALRRREESFVDFMALVIRDRRRTSSKGEKTADDMLAWLLEQAARDGSPIDVRHIARTQLALFAVAFHTTGLTATNVFFDLAAEPRYIQPLRDQMSQALREEESDDIQSSRRLQGLIKLDSFIKESLRFRPLSIATFQRRVLKPTTLSDGQYIPKGTIIEMPTHAMTRDTDHFTNPETFEPWRFAEVRDGEKGRNQFASVSGMLGTFGFGPHACPGRFFAAAVLKIVIAGVLVRYDVQMPIAEGGRRQERYKNVEFSLMSSPDTSKEILVRWIEESC